jgi:two-component system, NarL family, nitrate/nitrite response regulator NarL
VSVAIRLVLADDHPIVLQGLRRLFEQQPDFDVVACCGDADAALAAVAAQPVDVLVLDYRMPGRNGLDVLRALATAKTACRPVILTAAIRDDEVVEAIELGLRGLVLKESAPDVLVECVRAVHRGEQWVERETLTRAFGRVLRRQSAARGAPANTLTRREIEIIKLVAEGLRNKEVAERLSISEGTVKIHLHHIYDKLGVDGRLELLLAAQQRGLL